MFNTIFVVVLVCFVGSMWIGDPSHANWPNMFGPHFLRFWNFCLDWRVFVSIVVVVVAIATFMTKKKY